MGDLWEVQSLKNGDFAIFDSSGAMVSGFTKRSYLLIKIKDAHNASIRLRTTLTTGLEEQLAEVFNLLMPLMDDGCMDMDSVIYDDVWGEKMCKLLISIEKATHV